MNPPGKTTAFDSFNEIATVRIELRDTDPVIWREVEVPTSITLKVLHRIIQAVMAWFDYHLWEFTIDKCRYGLSTDEDRGTEPRIAAAQGAVARCGKAAQDHDRLSLRLRRLLGAPTHGHQRPHRRSQSLLPRYIAGERNAPPEDCGGIAGFYQTLDAVADPKHPNHAEAKEWLDDYDPNIVDELPIKYALGRIANQRNATKVRLAKKKTPPITG